jgi:hypothetical protein
MSQSAQRMGAGLLMLAALMAAGRVEAADKQIRPFVGATFGGGTSFVDLESAAGKANPVVGVSAVRLGELFGVDLDVADAPGFFQSGGKHLVLSSRVTTVTANVVVAAPGRLTEYSLRPYLVGGAGLIRVRIDDYFGALRVSSVLPAFDIGGGAAGFLSNRLGVFWEVRRFQSLSRNTQDRGVTFGEERLSFWRASMGLAIRY